MRDILEKIVPWWETGQTFGLATVTNTYRSAPRDPGAALAVSLLRAALTCHAGMATFAEAGVADRPR